ncbi:MAG: helix-turn-helix domain-containing protein [Acutalibacteraceae bacterium]|nr:helix-turn-helix domain-containing protein [Acutalibacteraceae bacterium]
MFLKDCVYLKNFAANDSVLSETRDNCIKIIHFVNGKGSVLLKDKLYPIKNNCVCIIDSHSLHCICSKGDQKLTVNILHLDREQLINSIENSKVTIDKYVNTVFALDNIAANKVNDIFSRIASFNELSDIFIIEKTLTLLRECAENGQPVNAKDNSTARTLEYVSENLAKKLDLDIISNALHTSVWHLCHTFKETTGLTIKEYVRLLRIRKAEELLKTTDYSISTISEMCGFDSFSFFSRIFSKETGKAPTAYRKNHTNALMPNHKDEASYNKYHVLSNNPILPIYEYTTIDLKRVLFDIVSSVGHSGDTLVWTSDEPNLIFDNTKHLLTAGKKGVYRATVTYKYITRTIIICVLPQGAENELNQYEVTLFEYDFENKTTEEILKDWVFQTRKNNVSTFDPPTVPKESTNKRKNGFIPFPASYKNENGEIVDICFNEPKGPTNVGFMYLKSGNLPELFSNYNIYCSGILTNLAKNVKSATTGSAFAKAGIVGRMRLNEENVIDYTSNYQVALTSVANSHFYTFGGKPAHQNVYLTENMFFEFGYDSSTPKFFGTDADEIKVGDTYTLLAEFYDNRIKTGIKKGDMVAQGSFATRTITENCWQPTTGANYVRGSKTVNYTASDAKLCTSFRGTVGFVYMGAETSITRFKVTHTVNTSQIPTVTFFNKQKIIQLVEKRLPKVAPLPEKKSDIPTRSLQKELNVRKHFIEPELIPENRLSKFCVFTNMHILHKDYFSDFEGSATLKQNFLKHINRSDSEFLISCGDNLADAHNYNCNTCIETNKNLIAFYDLMTYLPDKDYFVLKGNRDNSTSDFADTFVIEEKYVTVIGFYASYLQYNASKNDALLSAGKISDETLNWLKQACDDAVSRNPDTHIIFVCHYSIFDKHGAPGFADDGYSGLAEINSETVKRNELLDIITAYGVELFISGHDYNNQMDFKEIHYRTGYNTGCINYCVGNMPVDCTIAKYTDENGLEKIKASMEQYFYGDFNRSAKPAKKSLIKSIDFNLNQPATKNRLKNARQFFIAKKLLTDTFSARYEGLYRYSFAYQGIHKIDGVSYYKFDVSALKYYIFDKTTIFADADEEISSPLLLSHIKDVYIPLDASSICEIKNGRIKTIEK